MRAPNVIYSGLCGVCGGDLSVEEALKGRCGKKNEFFERYFTPREFYEFSEFFKKSVGELRSVQKFWAKRVFFGESFTAVATTGVGKTSFGLMMALFMALKKRRSYVLFPTTLLLNQAVSMIRSFAEKQDIDLSINEDGGDVRVIYYHSGLKKAGEKFFHLLDEGEFEILVTTPQFLSRHFERLRETVFDFIFVDDVDSILRASKNVERILVLLGFRKHGDKWTGSSRGVLIVSTATARSGKKTRILRKLLNFDVGSSAHTMRNIEDVFVSTEDLSVLKEILRKAGKGGIIYTESSERSEEIYRSLKGEFRTGLVTGRRKEDYRRFERGEIDYLVGTAHYYGLLVRGLDLPEKIRYCVFVSAPVMRFRIEDVENAGPGMVRALAVIFRGDEEVKGLLKYLPEIEKDSEKLLKLKKAIKNAMERGSAGERDIVFVDGELVFPDVRTYIQGSGRTSRMFSGGITKGISFLMEDDERILRAFRERAKLYDIEFKSLGEVDLEAVMKEVNLTREKCRERTGFEDKIKPTLFIVESPTKAKQISRFFGHPAIKILTEDDGSAIAYEVATPDEILIVTASLGHVTDLVPDRGFFGVELNGDFTPVYGTIKRCRSCGHQFTDERKDCPKCHSYEIDDTKGRIEALRKLAVEAGRVVIGTDPDAEGEKIAWDLKNLLSGSGEIKRAEFHEVTKKGVLKALRNLRDVDENLVASQIVRRIEDRWIGFILSRILWKKFNDHSLSAGRAQTPVLGWIVERARKSRRRKRIGFIKELGLSVDDPPSNRIEIEISAMFERDEEKTPPPPYTTDAMMRDAVSILKIPVKEAMEIAQNLFETGLITYHRTDSTRVSEDGLRVAIEFLGKDATLREWAREGAHECIRPTKPLDRDTLYRLIQEGVIQVEGLSWRHFALYDLIFRRFMASQCPPVRIRRMGYRVRYGGGEIHEERIVRAEGRGYELYRWGFGVRDPLPEGKFTFDVEIRHVPSVPLYTQSEIVHMMREKGIGRSSTYATIVEKLFARGYIRDNKGRIFPTRLGRRVFSFLNSRFGNLVSEERTRLLMNKMDAIGRGEMEYHAALEELYREVTALPEQDII